MMVGWGKCKRKRKCAIRFSRIFTGRQEDRESSPPVMFFARKYSTVGAMAVAVKEKKVDSQGVEGKREQVFNLLSPWRSRRLFRAYREGGRPY